MNSIELKTIYGIKKCEFKFDGLGNPRCYPNDSVTLEEWRKDESLCPPWLLPSDISKESKGEYQREITALIVGS